MAEVNVGKASGYLDLNTTGWSTGIAKAMSDLSVLQQSGATNAKKLAGVGAAMTTLGKGLTMGVTVPLVAAGTGFVATAAKFEQGMKDVQAVSGASVSDLEKLSEKAKEMGATTKFSATQSAEALKYMAMAGWDTEKMLAALPGVMDLAAASGEELGLVSDIVTDSMTAFGLKADQAGMFADVLAQAANKSNTGIALMGETFKYVAPVAGALGFNVQDVSTAVGLMANSGIKGSQAGTTLRGVLTRLAKPTAESAKAMQELNISMTNSDGTMKSLKEIMVDMRNGFAGLTEAEKAEMAANLGGQEAMSGLLAIVNASDEDFNTLSAAMYDSEGAAEEMAKVMQDSLVGQLTITKSAIEGIAIAFGELMLPAIKRINEMLQGLLEKINNLSEGQKQTILTILAVVAAIGPLLLIGGKIITGITTIMSTISSLSAVAAGLGVTLGALAWPIAAIVAGIALLAAAWATNFGGIREFTAETFAQIQEIVGIFLELLSEIWNSKFLGIKDTVMFVFQQIQLQLSTVLEAISGLIQVFVDVLNGNWSGAWEGVKNVFSIVWQGILSLLGNFLNFIIDRLLSIAANLWVAAKTVFGKIKDGFVDRWNAIKAWFNAAKEDPVGALKSIGTAMYNAARSVFISLWNGFKSKWGDIKTWFNEKIEWLKSKVNIFNREKSKAEKKSKGGSHRYGLGYVPYDGYVATLHEGERVLTKEEVNEQPSEKNNYEINFYSPEEKSPYEQAMEMKRLMNKLNYDF